MKSFRLILLFFLVQVVLFGCSPVNTGENGAGYPMPTSGNVDQTTIDNSYPSPATPASGSNGNSSTSGFAIPTPEADKAVITGQMLTPGPGGTPYIGDLYLAGTIYPDKPGYPPMIKFSEEDSPKAIVDATGEFYFSQISPGTYALVVYSLGGTYIVPDKNEEPMLITIKEGGTKELGVISIK